MSWPTALTSEQYTALRGKSWAGQQFVTFDPCATVLACRVNGAIPSGTPFAQITYDTVTVGAFANVEINQVVLISKTNDPREAYIRGRVRKLPTATILFVNETSSAINDNDFIFVLDTYDLTYRMPRGVDNGATQFKDFDLPYAPPPPVVSGLATGYAGFVAPATGRLRLTLSVTGIAVNAVASIASFAWSFKAGTATVISGSLASSAVTVDIAEGWQWATLVVTDTAGQSVRRKFAIAAHGNTFPAPDGFGDIAISGSQENGYTAQVTVLDGVTNLLDETFAMIWTDDYYNDVQGRVVGANGQVDFVGWLNSESRRTSSDPRHSVNNTLSFELDGIGARLAKLVQFRLALRFSLTPTVWDELDNLTPGRACAYYLAMHSTATNLCSFNFSLSTLFVTKYLATQGGNIWADLRVLAGQIVHTLEHSPSGFIQVVPDARYLPAVDRAVLTTVANFNDQDVISVEEPYIGGVKVGRVEGAGGFYNQTSGTVDALRSDAPGYARLQPASTTSMTDQILTVNGPKASAQSELNQRVGDRISIENTSLTLSVEFTAGNGWLVPTLNQLYTFDLPADPYSKRNITFTIAQAWLCVSVSIAYSQATGGRRVNATFTSLTDVGIPGDAIPIITPGTTPNLEFPPLDLPPLSLPDFEWPELGWLPGEAPASALQPPPGQIAPLDGNSVIHWTATGLWRTITYIKLRAPRWIECTPPLAVGFTIRHCAPSKHYTSKAVPCYVLASDGTVSRVYYTANVYAGTPKWVEGATIAGVYNLVRPTSAQNTILIEAHNISAQTFVAASTNNGSTFATPIAVGTNVTGGSGFDVQHVGSASLVGTNLQVKVATTLGGGYANDAFGGLTSPAQPNCLVVPFNKIGDAGVAANNLSIAAPNYVVASKAFDGAGESIWVRTDAARVGITPGITTISYSDPMTSALGVRTRPAKVGDVFGFVNSATVAGSFYESSGGRTGGGRWRGGVRVDFGISAAVPALVVDLGTLAVVESVSIWGFVDGSPQEYNPRIQGHLLMSQSPIATYVFANIGSGTVSPGWTQWSYVGTGTPSVRFVSFEFRTRLFGFAGATLSALDDIEITYKVGNGVIASENSIATWKGTICYSLLVSGGKTFLYQTDNMSTAAGWLNRGEVPGAIYVRGRRASPNGRQVFMGGGGKLWYSASKGSVLAERTPAAAAGILGIEVIG